MNCLCCIGVFLGSTCTLCPQKLGGGYVNILIKVTHDDNKQSDGIVVRINGQAGHAVSCTAACSAALCAQNMAHFGSSMAPVLDDVALSLNCAHRKIVS